MGEVVRIYSEDVEVEKKQAEVVKIPKYCKERDENGERVLKNTFNEHERGGKSYPLKTEKEIHDVIAYWDNEFETDTRKKYKNLAARNVMMLTLGFNMGIRGSDLLPLKWKQVFYEDGNFIDEDDEVTIREEKTDKIKGLIFNEACQSAITEYIERTGIKVNLDDYLFYNGRGGHINVQSCSLVLKEAASACGIRRPIASHTLRKTFSLFQIKAHRSDSMFINELQALLNHSTPEMSLKYCGLTDERLKQYHHDVNLGRVCDVKESEVREIDSESTVISKSDLKYLIKQATIKCSGCINNCEDCYMNILINRLGYGSELIK